MTPIAGGLLERRAPFFGGCGVCDGDGRASQFAHVLLNPMAGVLV